MRGNHYFLALFLLAHLVISCGREAEETSQTEPDPEPAITAPAIIEPPADTGNETDPEEEFEDPQPSEYTVNPAQGPSQIAFGGKGGKGAFSPLQASTFVPAFSTRQVCQSETTQNDLIACVQSGGVLDTCMQQVGCATHVPMNSGEQQVNIVTRGASNNSGYYQIQETPEDKSIPETTPEVATEEKEDLAKTNNDFTTTLSDSDVDSDSDADLELATLSEPEIPDSVVYSHPWKNQEINLTQDEGFFNEPSHCESKQYFNRLCIIGVPGNAIRLDVHSPKRGDDREIAIYYRTKKQNHYNPDPLVSPYKADVKITPFYVHLKTFGTSSRIARKKGFRFFVPRNFFGKYVSPVLAPGYVAHLPAQEKMGDQLNHQKYSMKIGVYHGESTRNGKCKFRLQLFQKGVSKNILKADLIGEAHCSRRLY